MDHAMTATAHMELQSSIGGRSVQLTDPWELGGVPIANRVVLAPLAGIGNWFVRLQAKRYGAGLVVSEMVSSHAVHHRNERTWRELLRSTPTSTRCRSSCSEPTPT
jgi:tRNA-dihydrouridine synthase